MTGMDELNKRIDALNKATEECREATREAHSIIKELRKVKKEIRDLLVNDTKQLVDDIIGEQVTKGLEALGVQTKEAMDASVQKVHREFEILAKLYMQGPDGTDDLHALAMRRKWGES